jgi:hypothetical protein
MKNRPALQTREGQAQNAYLASLRTFTTWDHVTGATYEQDTDPDYWLPRDHSSNAVARATVAPREDAPTMFVGIPARAAFRDMHARNRRQATLQACKVQESARRAMVATALRALDALLTPREQEVEVAPKGTLLDQLEALYAQYKQANRESAALMAYLPFDGRPPLIKPTQNGAHLVNGQENRASERWLATPNKVQECRRLVTVPINGHAAPRWSARDEWNAAVDRGAVVTVMTASRKVKTNRKGNKVAPTVIGAQGKRLKGNAVTAASLPRVIAD